MKHFFTATVAYMLIFLFTYTAISKLYDPYSFIAVLKTMPVINIAADIVARFIPVSELALVGLLFFEKTRLTGFKLSVAILTVFTVYLVYAMAVSNDLPCSCGGIISSMTWKEHLVFNSFLILITLAAIRADISIKNSRTSYCNKQVKTFPESKVINH